MRRVLESLLMTLGVASLFLGLRSIRDEPPPKPTEQDQVTRVDYLSGRYRDALEDREQTIRKRQRRGQWLAGAGLLFVAGGIGCLLASGSEEPAEESEPYAVTDNGHQDSRERTQSPS